MVRIACEDSRIATPNLSNEIKRLEDFLRQLKLEQEVSDGWTAEPFTLVTRADFSVILQGQDAEIFALIVDALYEAIRGSRAITKGTVSHLASDCLAKVAKKADSCGGSSFDALLQSSLQELRERLSAPDMPWRFILPIGGLAPSGLPMTVGQVDFRFADQQTIDDLSEQARNIHSRTGAFDEANAFAEGFNKAVSKFQDCAIACIEVKAVDDEGARSVALKTLRSTLDCINFYADRNRWGMWAYLYGDTSSVDEPFVAFRLSNEGSPESYKVGGHLVGPTRSLPLNQLGKLKGFSRISEMLANPKGSAEERVLTSIQWAGRAQVDPRPEEAFLLYAISLEALLLGKRQSVELSYRLGLSCAHLVSLPGAKADGQKTD